MTTKVKIDRKLKRYRVIHIPTGSYLLAPIKRKWEYNTGYKFCKTPSEEKDFFKYNLAVGSGDIVIGKYDKWSPLVIKKQESVYEFLFEYVKTQYKHRNTYICHFLGTQNICLSEVDLDPASNLRTSSLLKFIKEKDLKKEFVQYLCLNKLVNLYCFNQSTVPVSYSGIEKLSLCSIHEFEFEEIEMLSSSISKEKY